MKKIVFGVVGLFFLVAGGVLIAPGMIDWEQHKPKIQSAIHDATGYDVSFGGPIKLAIIPFPHVALENLVIRVPAGEGRADPIDILKLGKAEVSVGLAPLFRGEVSVNSVTLVDPAINLAVSRDGRKLWMTDILQAASDLGKAGRENGSKPATAGGGAKFALEKLQVQNGTFLYADASKGVQHEISGINAVLSADSLAGPFHGRGSLIHAEQKLDFDIQTGRIDTAAKTISLQASAKMPGNGAAVTYTGIVGTAGILDLQGEVGFESTNISATLAALSGKPSALPPHAARVTGMLTVKPEQADIKSAKVVFGDMKAEGTAGITNLMAQNGPMIVAITLRSDSMLNLESFMPVKSVKTVKAAANTDVPKIGGIKTFLPQTVAWPVPLDGKVDMTVAGMSYKGTTFNDINVTLEKKGSQITLTENIGQMPGGGTLQAKAGLVFESGSQTAGKARAVYADPKLTYDIKGDAKAPGRLFSTFLPEATIKSMQPLFKNSVSMNMRGTVQSNKILVEAGALSLGKTTLGLGASSYTLNPAGRDDVVVAISAQDINIDHFTAKPPTSATQDKVQTAVAPATKPAGQVLQENLKKLKLPVDLAIKADMKNVTMQGVTYRAVKIDGAVKGNALDLKSASLTDPEGDVMEAAGTVRDLQTLSGVDMTLGGKTSDAIAFLSSFKVDTAKMPKDFGPLNLSVTLSGESADSLAFKAKANALGGEGHADGLLVKALSAKPGVDKLSLRVTHANFEQLVQKFNPSYKAGVGIRKDMDVTANVNLDGDTYNVSAIKAMVAAMDLTGTVQIRTGGAKPDITAVLNAGTIPLDILSGKNRTAKTTAGSQAKVNAGASGDVRWSRNAINTSMMHAFNLDLKVNAKKVEYSNWTLDDTILAMTLKDGVFALGQMDAKVYGGTMNLTATAKSSGKDRDPLSFNVKSDFKDVGLEQLATSFSGARVVKARGNASLGFEASSSGISPAALVSALNGKGNLTGSNVVLQGFDLAAMSRSLVSTTKVVDNVTGLAKASFSGGETAFDKIDGAFTITEGNINFDNFLMTGPTANIANRGQISLPRWYIDMNSSIDLAQPEDAPNLDIRFQGPLDNPGNTFAGAAMESYIGARVNQKLQKVIGEKLGDKAPELNNLLNNVLGGGRPAQPAPAQPQQPEQPEQQIAPASGDAPPPAAEPASEPAAQQPAPSPEEQIMRGVLQGILGQ